MSDIFIIVYLIDPKSYKQCHTTLLKGVIFKCKLKLRSNKSFKKKISSSLHLITEYLYIGLPIFLSFIVTIPKDFKSTSVRDFSCDTNVKEKLSK